MISVKMAGRLGNQLFIYAYAVAASRRLKTRFVINYEDPIEKNFSVPNFFECREFSSCKNVILRKFFLRFQNRIPRVETDAFSSPHDVLQNEKNWRQYLGFMQSEEYFKDSVSLVKSEYRIKKLYRDVFLKKYGEILKSKKKVVIHCRRTDYVEFGFADIGFNLVLPFAYYERCLEKIENIVEYEVFFVGDDLADVRAHFGERENYHYETNEMIVDFQLLQHAQIAIISNSTFAWWAAYLSYEVRPLIFAPKHWLGFKVAKEFPPLITSISSWNWVDASD